MHPSPQQPEATRLSLGRPRNRLLAALPAEDLEQIRPQLEQVTLQRGLVLQEFHQAPKRVFFIESGLASLQVQTGRDKPIEVGLVGRMGLVGAPVVLGTSHAPIRAVMQISGEALAIQPEDLSAAMARSTALQHLLLKYLQTITVQTSQLVLCNARHETDQRVARWLLLAHDRLDGNEIHITQEVLSSCLGVRRPSVTDAVHRLQDAGILQTQRACITILDRRQLEAHACDCYRVISCEYAQLLARNTTTGEAHRITSELDRHPERR